MTHREKFKPRTLHISLKGPSLAQLIVFCWLPIRFHSQNYSEVNRN